MGSEALLPYKEAIHYALKLWHQLTNQTSPLNDLVLFNQAFRELNDVRTATNRTLEQGLEALRDDDSQAAELLRKRYLDKVLIESLANQRNVSVTVLYRQQRQALTHLAEVMLRLEQSTRTILLAELEKRLNLPGEVSLFGVDSYLTKLLNMLNSLEAPWLISIEGIGGIGKTALANKVVRHLMLTNRKTKDVGWVSAKQQRFLLDQGLKPVVHPALESDALIAQLLSQLQPETLLPPSPQEQEVALAELLKAAPYLIVIDNLETVSDYETLLPTLKRLANPTRFLLTSRYSLKTDESIFCLRLSELNQKNTIALLRYETEKPKIARLARVSSRQLKMIYQAVGGNPLALKLVIAQIMTLPLTHVLESLKHVEEKTINELYTYIYWHTWQMLDEVSQQVLLAVSIPSGIDFAALQATTAADLSVAALSEGLKTLNTLSLIEVRGNLENPNYHTHQLTRTFLFTEVAAGWNEES